MRFVIFGAGAIGGALGARLCQGGFEVSLIARGPHLDAIRRDGLTLVTPEQRFVLALEATADPAQIDWRGDEVVLLATKSQDTLAALLALRDAAGSGTPVVCMQNGVDNERLALRVMKHVYGAAVMLPAAHLEPGVVLSYGARLTGMLDLGRVPGSVDELCEQLCDALAASGFEARALPDVMRAKHAKLLLNLGNAVEALFADSEARAELSELARAEGRAALSAARIEFADDAVTDVRGRWRRMGVAEIDGRPRVGSSTWQSLARFTGTLESDYLNGEIVMIGALHGVPTPVNQRLCELAASAARDRLAPQTLAAQDVLAAVAA
ncbi:MAG: ketopantoate reductase family protein [Solirubrobacteraceae bacterium]